MQSWRTPFTFGARLALGAMRAAGTGRANGARLAVRAGSTSLAFRTRRALGTAFALTALRTHLALEAAPYLQRQQDVGRSFDALDRSDADLAALGAERQLLAALGRSCAGLGLLGVLFLNGLGHSANSPGRLWGR
ncbi:MAG TPA: hypothetical protein VG758_06760 [Hyphomicrobiaceae bacterium]|nr:hypothetical protein [Hyphomicrobiaceae bacterium]